MSTIEEIETSLCYSVSPSKSEISVSNSSDRTSQASARSGSTVNPRNSEESSQTVVSQSSKSLNGTTTTIDPFEKITNKENGSPPRNTSGYRQYRMHTARSPLRPDLVKKTQDAINKASASVNNSLNAVRNARQYSQRSKTKNTTQIRDEWKEDTQKALQMQQEIEKNRHEILHLQKQLSSQNSREKARRAQASRMKKVYEIDQEVKFKSEVYRDHQDTIREEAAVKRRHSALVKEKIRKNHRQGQQKLREREAEELQAISAERHAATVAGMEFQKNYSKQRRMSYAFRNGDARRIRQIHAQMEAERLQKQHENFELQRQAASDVDKYRQKMEEERRLSYAARNQRARQVRQEEMARQSEKAAQEHESFELWCLANGDVDEYKKEMERQRRESLANRNSEAARRRKLESELRSQELAAQHSSFELKWAGERDASEYQKQMDQLRRDSLAFRNKEGGRIRDLDNQLKSESQQAQAESYQLKWDGERDAEAYKKQQQEEKRMSLELRNKEGKRIRDLEQQLHCSEIQARQESNELKWAGDRDAEEYRKFLAQQEREDLAFRNRERQKHSQVMQELQSIAHEKEVESLVLKWAGENDAQEYLRKLEQERRESLQLRGKEVLHHREVAGKQRDQELAQQHEDEVLRAGGQKDVEEYRKQCAARDRASLEYRRKEARKQRLEETERKAQESRNAEEAVELERQAHTDVQDYIKECKQRRRMSLAVRAKEKRKHARWTEDEKQRQITARRNLVSDRLLDQHYVELARQRERARIAMDAIKHSNCTFNPFQSIL